MKNSDYLVGLDIGTTKIVTIVAKIDAYNKIEVLGLGKARSLGVKRGVVNNIGMTIDSIKQAVEFAEKASGKKITEVTVGIAGQHIRSIQDSDYIIREKSDQTITEKDIERLCEQANKLSRDDGEEIIHVLPQEFKVDGEPNIVEPVGMYGARLDANFHIVVGQKSSIRNIRDCVEKSGLKLAGMMLEPIASSDAVLSDEEKEAGVVLIDIGGGTTDLAIFKDGIIRHTAVIPIGGNIITEDIREGCSILIKHAEQVKRQYGSAWPSENKENEFISIPGLRGREAIEISKKSLSKIIHARMTEIISHIFSEIKAYGHNEQRKKLIGGIVLTGGGSELTDLKQLVEYCTGMHTRIGIPNEHLAGNSQKELTSPIYATSIGLVLNAHLELKRKNNLSSETATIDSSETSSDISKNNESSSEDLTLDSDKKSKTLFMEKTKKSYIEKIYDRLKNFLEQAE